MAAALGAAKVLIVEDESEIATTLAEVLDFEGYRVAVAKDGVHAFEQLPGFKPDLILLDLMMPRMNGFEVLERLREERNTVPVIVVSANQGYEAEDLKVAGKVRKPVGLQQLLDAVTAALAKAPSS